MRHDHAQVLAPLTLDMRDFVIQRRFGQHKISLRIGINSGPVVAGVIGRKKFIYDFCGDAVNTASRMESHGSNGTIQMTRTTYELIKTALSAGGGARCTLKEDVKWRHGTSTGN